MPVPSFKLFVEPLLRVLAEHPDGIKAGAAHDLVAARLGLSESERAELLPSGEQPVYKNRDGWAHDRLKRAGLSESASPGHWRLTQKGVTFARTHAAITADQLAELTDVAERDEDDVWRERLLAFRADPASRADLQSVRARRNQARPELAKLTEQFVVGEIGLEQLRSTFDQKTRTDWETLGAKGANGAMTLNQLVKGSPNLKGAEDALRKLLKRPNDEAGAAVSLREFATHIASAEKAAPPGTAFPAEGRLRFFASIFWHVQAPEAWPVFYETARSALETGGIYDPTDLDFADDYLAFRGAYLKLGSQLGIDTLELERMLVWIEATDGSTLAPPAAEDVDVQGPRVWLIALGANADQWDACYTSGLIAIGWNDLGDLTQYPSVDAVRAKLREQRNDGTDPINAGLACWQFGNVMRKGDLVYVKRGRHYILGHGVVTSDYRFEGLKPLAHVRDVKWLARGEWKLTEKALAMKTLTEIGNYPALLKEIREVVGGDSDQPAAPVASAPPADTYGYDDAERDLFLSRAKLEEIVELCRYKKNLILQGPPGVGKTFVASRLAHVLIGSTNEDQIQRVQFHPSYSYEDFVQGLRPTESGGFVRKDGPLLTFCKDALEDQASTFVLIIDEINRGNVSKILGELLSLLEADKRDARYGVTLAYAREDEPRFHVPPNLHVIGMMNTADRSLAFVDYALRRRFVFVDIDPAFETDRFEADLTRRGADATIRKAIRERLGKLNELIDRDPALGPGFRIGHSYFCQRSELHDDAWLRRIVDFEIKPLLREYWFDNPKKLEEATAILQAE